MIAVIFEVWPAEGKLEHDLKQIFQYDCVHFDESCVEMVRAGEADVLAEVEGDAAVAAAARAPASVPGAAPGSTT